MRDTNYGNPERGSFQGGKSSKANDFKAPEPLIWQPRPGGSNATDGSFTLKVRKVRDSWTWLVSDRGDPSADGATAKRHFPTAEEAQAAAEAAFAELKSSPPEEAETPDLPDDPEGDAAAVAEMQGRPSNELKPKKSPRELKAPHREPPTELPPPIEEAPTEPEAYAAFMAEKRERDKQTARLRTGSDIEIAQHLKPLLDTRYGDVVFCEDKFWRYKDTQWSEISPDEIWHAAAGYDGATYGTKGIVRLNESRIKSILTHLEKLYSQPGFFNSAPRGVNCLSGFVRFASDGTPSLSPHTAAFRQRDTLQGHWLSHNRVRTIPHSSLIHTLLYRSTADDPEQPDKVEALLRLFGAVVAGLGTRGTNPKVVILKGASKAGKGQLLTVLRGLVPASAQCSISPSQFADKHFVVELAGKRLNTYDELGSTYAVTSEVFKQITTGDPITGCRKYGHPFTFTPRAQHVFACNLLPSFRGGVDKAVLNRLYIIQFDREIPLEERVDRIGERIVAEEMDLLLGLGIEGATRFIQNDGFPSLKSADVELAELAETDSVTAWFKDRITQTAFEVVEKDGTLTPLRLTTGEMYEDYKTTSLEQGHDSKSIVHVNVFSQRLRSLGLKRVNANGFRGFVGVRFKTERAAVVARKPKKFTTDELLNEYPSQLDATSTRPAPRGIKRVRLPRDPRELN
jgi:phage/plasmid-associated DNA primase